MARKDEYAGLRRGFWGKFFHSLTLPFRKPLVLIVILCVLYVAPITQGVAYNKVHVWYKEQILSLWAKITGDTYKFVGDNSTQVGNRGIDKVVETPDYVVGDSVAARRGAFGKSADAPKTLDVLAGEEVVSVVASDRGDWVVAEARSPSEVDKKVDRAPIVEVDTASIQIQVDNTPAKLNLKYLDIPQEVNGVAKVVNANEIRVGEFDMFLYGIYVDPNTSQGIRGENYLKEMIEGRQVTCSIVAYTFQDVATAKCSIGYKNINKAMVDAGFSKDVALDK